MVSVTNINDVLDGHVGLDLDCIDRLYLNAYVPDMAVGGQVARFLTPTALARSLTCVRLSDRDPG